MAAILTGCQCDHDYSYRMATALVAAVTVIMSVAMTVAFDCYDDQSCDILVFEWVYQCRGCAVRGHGCAEWEKLFLNTCGVQYDNICHIG